MQKLTLLSIAVIVMEAEEEVEIPTICGMEVRCTHPRTGNSLDFNRTKISSNHS